MFLSGTKSKMQQHKTEIALVLGSLATIFLFLEIVFRFLMTTSQISSGLLFGREIPPVRTIPKNLDVDRDIVTRHYEQYKDLIVDGNQITYGDLFGVMREDPDLAYAPLENFKSANGWWISDRLGARRDSEANYFSDAERKRTLMFGDSYTQGSRVEQKDSFSAILDQRDPGRDYINFGVDGYSTGQAYLRYQQVKDKVSFDRVVLTLVPTADLWRDISVSRYFGDRWDSYKLQPRFHLDEGELKLVKSPFTSLALQLKDGPNFPVSRAHLLLHDAFYFTEYEPSPLTDRIVTIRFVRAAIASYKRKSLHRRIRDPDGEAVAITRAIIDRMRTDVINSDAKFTLAILPTFADMLDYNSNVEYRTEWKAMSNVLCESVDCIRLVETLTRHEISDFDFGYDGTHYGPYVNTIVAEAINSHF